MAKGATKEMAVWVVRRLRRAGHEAMLAGGCVRDMLLGRRPADYDVATSATPQQVKKIFRRVVMIGAKFGVAMVIRNRRPVEVTTFRTDLSYTDGRRPDAVEFVSAREDAFRRDFTINGMFYDPVAEQVVDHVGGQADLKAGLIRAIGDPEVRFSEDYLRMLRAVRFGARLGFRIDRSTAGAITRRAGRIKEISGERIRDELEGMFAEPSSAGAVRQMHQFGLLEAILPELFAEPDRWGRAIRRLEAVARRSDVRLDFAALLADLPPGELRKIVRRWGGSNDLRDGLVWLAEHLHHWKDVHSASLAGLKRLLARRDFRRLQALWRIEDAAATGGTACCQAVARRIRRIDRRKIAPRPFVNGNDLKEMGAQEDPLIGGILSQVYEAQLNEEITGRAAALKLAGRLIAEQVK